MSPIALAILTTSLTLCCVIVFLVERSRGKRFLPRFREFLDGVFARSYAELREYVPEVNRAFFLHTFHYVVHKLLSLMLRIVERFERGIRVVVRFNRTKAKERIQRVSSPDTHLQKIAEHKEATALSSDQKAVWKEAALRGDVSIGVPVPETKKKSRKTPAEHSILDEESSAGKPFV